MSSIFSDLVSFFGGQVATAKALGVTQGTVSGWIRGVHGCSADIAFLAQVKTGGHFKADQLRPSLAASLPTLDQTIPGNSDGNQSYENAGVLSSGQRGL
jgi:DNA-binding transcriptional regulator YdaS (Cro superfamily)